VLRKPAAVAAPLADRRLAFAGPTRRDRAPFRTGLRKPNLPATMDDSCDEDDGMIFDDEECDHLFRLGPVRLDGLLEANQDALSYLFDTERDGETDPFALSQGAIRLSMTSKRMRLVLESACPRIALRALLSESPRLMRGLVTMHQSGRWRIVTIHLRGEEIKDVSPLSGLTSLVKLYLGGTNIRDVSQLKGLTSLTELNLSATQIKDASPLSGLTSLTKLDLSGTQIKDVSPLSGLTSLTTLGL
jgi:hypothetical protein